MVLLLLQAMWTIIVVLCGVIMFRAAEKREGESVMFAIAAGLFSLAVITLTVLLS